MTKIAKRTTRLTDQKREDLNRVRGDQGQAKVSTLPLVKSTDRREDLNRVSDKWEG